MVESLGFEGLKGYGLGFRVRTGGQHSGVGVCQQDGQQKVCLARHLHDDHGERQAEPGDTLQGVGCRVQGSGFRV